MGRRDRRVDAYIAKSAEFAKPILKRLRQLVHKGCPEVEETLKWSSPAFMYKGMLCGMAAFKEHAVFGFWKHKLLLGSNKGAAGAMGSYGRLTSLTDLPSDKIILDYIKKAIALNDAGIKYARPKFKPKNPLRVPSYLRSALSSNKKAQSTFDNFSYSHKKEYIEWITEAKTEETRNKRIEIALEWMAEGKSRNWKYMKR